MKTQIHQLFLALMILLLPLTAQAQQQRDYLAEGKQAYREAQFEDAATAFERHAEQHPDDAEAYYLLARVYFETPLRDTKKASRAIDQALELEPENLQFMVARLEQLRTDSWNFFAERVKERKRIELSEDILALDPDNPYAHEELGSMYIRDFWRYRNAISVPNLQFGQKRYRNPKAEGYISTEEEVIPDVQGGQTPNPTGVSELYVNPNLNPLEQTNINDPADVFLADKFDIETMQAQGVPVQQMAKRAQRAYDQAVGHLNKALEIDPRRRSVYDELMQIYALKGEYKQALTMLQQMYQFFPDDPGLWTYLGLAHAETGNLEAADRSFETAFRFMQPETENAYRDISYVLPGDEEARYEDDPVAYAARFWTSKDPRYLTPYNERKIEHYKRLAYADLLYGAPDVDLRGWETERGRILVRYGKPVADVVLIPDNLSRLTRDQLLTRALATDQGETTLYNLESPEALLDDPSDLFDELNTYNIWEYGDFRFVFEDPFRNGTYRLYSPPATDVALGVDAWVNDYEMRARETFRRTPERYEFEVPGRRIELPYIATAFKGEGDKADLYVNYGIPITEFSQSQDRIEVTANTGMFLVNDNRDILVERRNTIYGLQTAQIVAFKDVNLWVDTQQMEAPPGKHEVSVEFETASGGAVAVQRRQVDVPNFGTDNLALSDLMLAYRVEDTPDGKPLAGSDIVRGGLSIQAAPWSVFGKDSPVYVYFEAYNLEKNAEGRTSYEVEIVLIPKEEAKGLAKVFKSIFGSEKGVAVKYEDGGTETDQGLYQIVDVQDEEPGLYTLAVRVRDLNAKRTVGSEQDLFLE